MCVTMKGEHEGDFSDDTTVLCFDGSGAYMNLPMQ